MGILRDISDVIIIGLLRDTVESTESNNLLIIMVVASVFIMCRIILIMFQFIKPDCGICNKERLYLWNNGLNFLGFIFPGIIIPAFCAATLLLQIKAVQESNVENKPSKETLGTIQTQLECNRLMVKYGTQLSRFVIGKLALLTITWITDKIIGCFRKARNCCKCDIGGCGLCGCCGGCDCLDCECESCQCLVVQFLPFLRMIYKCILISYIILKFTNVWEKVQKCL